MITKQFCLISHLCFFAWALIFIDFPRYLSIVIYIYYMYTHTHAERKIENRKATLPLLWFVSCWRNITATLSRGRVVIVNGLTTCFRPFQDFHSFYFIPPESLWLPFFSIHPTKFPLFSKKKKRDSVIRLNKKKLIYLPFVFFRAPLFQPKNVFWANDSRWVEWKTDKNNDKIGDTEIDEHTFVVT